MNIKDCSVHFAGGVNVVVRAVTGPVAVVAVADVVIGAVLAIFFFESRLESNAAVSRVVSK